MSKYIFLNIFGRLETNPIVEIDISRWRCKSDFSPLFDYKYPGHYSGCYNNSTGYFNKDTNKEECRKIINSFYIQGMDETPMNAWRSKVICVRRESYSYKSVFAAANEECPKGYKFCGRLNQFNDKFCVIKKNKCPIFYLDIKLIDKINKTDDTIQFKQLDTNMVLVYSNNSTELLNEEGNFIKNDFQVAVNFPCIKKNQISTFDDGNIFPLILEQNKKKIGCKPQDNHNYHDNHNENDVENNRNINLNRVEDKNKYILKDDKEYYFDKRYIKIDSYKISEFNSNNDMNYLNDIPNLKNWKQIKDKEIILYSRPYTYPNFTCADVSHISEINNSYVEIKLMHYVVIVLLLSNLIVLCLFISILSLMKITSRNQNLFLSILKIIQSFIFLYFIADNILSIREKDEDFKTFYSFLFQNENCIDIVSKNGLEKIYHFQDGLVFREYIIELIYYAGFPYLSCIIIQLIKFLHKLYLRIRNKDRNKQAKGLFEILGHKNFN